jgi:exoribonuclease-2
MKDGLVRAESLPLVLRAAGTEALARGARVRVRVASIDLLTLDAHAVLVTRLAEANGGEAASAADDAPGAGADGDEDDGAIADAGALSLAIEVDDAAPAVAPSP